MMARDVEFVVILDDGVRKRHCHKTEKGKVVFFAVQLEVRVKGEWKTVIRYDCSHRFSHVDKYDAEGNKAKTTLDLGFESALTFGDWDINENWLKYKQEFLEGLKND